MTPAHRGMTLAEVLVVIVIVSVLIGVFVIGGRAVYNAQNRSSAMQQINLIAAAIDKYASYWPAWTVRDAFGREVKLAERGWPDYLPGRLFATGFPNSPYRADVTGRFNDPVDGWFFVVADNAGYGNGSGIIEQADGDQVVEGDVLNANICLAYGLTAAVGDGPYLVIDDNKAVLADVAGQVPTMSPQYPEPNETATTNLHAISTAGRKLMLVDPWGTPYRYFWVYRAESTLPDGTPATPSGLAPVWTGNIGAAEFRTAVGYVLESAGPDRKFGNRWVDPANLADPIRELDEAADNLVIQRP